MDLVYLDDVINHWKSQLYTVRCSQINFYFSNSNLKKNNYLQSLMDDEGYVKLTSVLLFRRLAVLRTSLDDLIEVNFIIY